MRSQGEARLKLNVTAGLPGPAGKVREQSPVVRGLPVAHAVARQRRKQRTMSTCHPGPLGFSPSPDQPLASAGQSGYNIAKASGFLREGRNVDFFF